MTNIAEEAVRRHARQVTLNVDTVDILKGSMDMLDTSEDHVTISTSQIHAGGLFSQGVIVQPDEMELLGEFLDKLKQHREVVRDELAPTFEEAIEKAKLLDDFIGGSDVQ